MTCLSVLEALLPLVWGGFAALEEGGSGSTEDEGGMLVPLFVVVSVEVETGASFEVRVGSIALSMSVKIFARAVFRCFSIAVSMMESSFSESTCAIMSATLGLVATSMVTLSALSVG